ncbi:hypothetical protein AB0H12_41570 [Actinosynnema sp. NPDC023794]
MATVLGLLGIVTDPNAMAGLSSPVAPSCAALAMVRPSLLAHEWRTTPPEVLREAGVLRVTPWGQPPRTSCGALQAKLWAADALADRAADLVEAINVHPDTVTERQRGEAAVVITAAKQRAIDTGLEIDPRVFDVTGARATANTVGLDISGATSAPTACTTQSPQARRSRPLRAARRDAGTHRVHLTVEPRGTRRRHYGSLPRFSVVTCFPVRAMTRTSCAALPIVVDRFRVAR